jgi:hypothetical protein
MLLDGVSGIYIFFCGKNGNGPYGNEHTCRKQVRIGENECKNKVCLAFKASERTHEALMTGECARAVG